jgi:hypothetical protein
MDWLDEVRKEWPVIRQAPLLFIGSLTVLCIAMGIAIWGIFKGNLERKNDLIKTLQD